MAAYIGIDTSNYTTSAAVYNSDKDTVRSCKRLLPVRDGNCGLRQSDAVFHHVQQFPEIFKETLCGIGGTPAAIGVSTRPRSVDGSYMPCFTVGSAFAKVLAAQLAVPLYAFSHQEGHIAAALYSSDHLDWLKRTFLAFHVSGGTTEALIVRPHEKNIFDIQLCAKTLDLNAGQLIDRVGLMLGLPFPAGSGLESLAKKYSGDIHAKATLKGMDCCLSGIENKCADMYRRGATKEKTAAYCLAYIEETLDQMCGHILEKYSDMPVLFAGGVMSNSIIRQRLSSKYRASFARPEFSSDNAAGTAILAYVIHEHKGVNFRVTGDE